LINKIHLHNCGTDFLWDRSLPAEISSPGTINCTVDVVAIFGPGTSVSFAEKKMLEVLLESYA
ncbi:MAG: hypothetical protein WD052_04170, partial [Bacteroidales bacterium]